MKNYTTQTSISGTNAIVDWILVELRSATNSGAIVHSMPALLARDGTIVGADGNVLTSA